VESAHAVILVVDDDTAIRELMVAAFEDEGYHVLQAADGAQALHLVSQTRPSVVVLDIQMPGIDGLEVARRLKADPETAAIPLVAVSAHARGAEVLGTGCCAFVAKPFDLMVLVSAVTSATGSP
jgi:CheY-like chemotaxis protein